jgi:activator of 2-hydroxyglutaryl-CoA dehydratase
VAFAGGVAKNVGVVRALQEVLGEDLIVPEEPQIVGALGAALVARDSVR